MSSGDGEDKRMIPVRSIFLRPDQYRKHWDGITPTKRSAHIRRMLDLADVAAEAVRALRELYELQTDAPLIRREAEWRLAMADAEAVLRKLEPLISEEAPR